MKTRHIIHSNLVNQTIWMDSESFNGIEPNSFKLVWGSESIPPWYEYPFHTIPIQWTKWVISFKGLWWWWCTVGGVISWYRLRWQGFCGAVGDEEVDSIEVHTWNWDEWLLCFVDDLWVGIFSKPIDFRFETLGYEGLAILYIN